MAARTFLRLFIPCVALVCTLASLEAQNDPDSPTANNHEVLVLPAPGAVDVDGKDGDWDLSAGIWSYNDPTLTGKYSLWTHLMWDEKGVYLLGRYQDSSPLKNTTRGEDFHQSWQADAFQGRVILDAQTPEEHQMHINIFHSSSEEKPYMIVKHGGFRKAAPYDGTGPDRPDQLEKYGTTMEKHGGKVAFRAWDNGQGYNMEAFWPWSYIRTNGQPMKPGEAFVFGVEAMWGSSDGTKLIQRIADNMKNDQVNRIFFFRARDGWGRAVIQAKGKSNFSEEQQRLHATRLKQFVDYDTRGSIPLKYDLPEDREVTIAIDNAEGLRVRNLFGQFPRSKGANTDFWDGLDDQGNPLPAGEYTVRVLDHLPVKPRLVNSVYNAATPPWRTETGIKLWGSNHGHPTTAATRGEVILLGFTGTEGGSGLMRITPEGQILWTDGTELLDLTLTDKYAYMISRESWTQKTMIRRLDAGKGTLVLFENAERSMDVTLPVPVKEVEDASIAYAYGKIFGYVRGKDFWRLHPDTGAIEATVKLPGLMAINNHDDKLLALFDDGSICMLDAEGRRGETVFTVKAGHPARFAISQDGSRYAVSDQATNQVLIHDAKGNLVATIGKPYAAVKGKRPAGKFVETDLIDPLGLAFDAQGSLWLAEAEDSNRRVTCWSGSGKLQKQFWGGADYGAMRGFPFLHDAKKFIAHGMEFVLDPIQTS